mmetsp:Transcript_21791/g.61915  ORF Transcript_21791/g.61915 Transcript_21791/m.61915 type:complete len:203 (+) Transcript_21791:52-660(+)
MHIGEVGDSTQRLGGAPIPKPSQDGTWSEHAAAAAKRAADGQELVSQAARSSAGAPRHRASLPSSRPRPSTAPLIVSGARSRGGFGSVLGSARRGVQGVVLPLDGQLAAGSAALGLLARIQALPQRAPARVAPAQALAVGHDLGHALQRVVALGEGAPPLRRGRPPASERELGNGGPRLDSPRLAAAIEQHLACYGVGRVAQ